MDLPKNIGDKDRNIRFAVGGVAIAAAWLLKDGSLALALIGLIALGTAYTRTCLAYKIFGFSTAGK